MEHRSKLDILSFGLALGITWGLGVLILGIHAWLTGLSVDVVNMLGSAYVGYKPTMLGSIIGATWGLVDGFVGGVIFAWIYNICIHVCHRKKKWYKKQG